MKGEIKKNLHQDHRQRVRNRFIREDSIENFEQHQVLELLLFYAIPRRDTNELAHKLINEYGSLNNLMSAKPQELIKRCKISEPTAVLLSIIPHLARLLISSKVKDDAPCISTYKIAEKYFQGLLIGKKDENFYMLCLDVNKKLIREIKISEGNSNSSPVYIDKVIQQALFNNAVFILIGHNHPRGNNRPSSADVDVTNKIVTVLTQINIQVLDHIIICGNENFSFARKKLCNLSY